MAGVTAAAPYLAGGAVAAGAMSPQQSQAAQDVEQLRNSHAEYSTRRAQKSSYWKARRDDVLNLARSVGSFAEDVAFPALPSR